MHRNGDSRRLSGIAVALVALLLGLAAPAHAQRVFALTDTTPPRIVSFDSGNPGSLLSDVGVSGLLAGEVPQGIDVRPTTGRLYLLAVTATGGARVMEVDPGTGATSNPVVLTAAFGDDNPFTTLDTSAGVGVDFNPVPDLAGNPSFRVITGNDQNMRVRVSTGEATTDTNINPAAVSIVASAYTNNDLDPATGTTLYGFDQTADALVVTANANGGTYITVGSGSGVSPASSSVGLDVSPTNAAYLSATAGAGANLYAMNLTTGTATPIGPIGDGTLPVKDISVRANLVAFGSPTATVPEGGGSVTLSINRFFPIASSTVRYQAAGGSASEGSDYPPTTGTVSFGPDETSKTISIPVSNDTADESDETVVVTLSDASEGPGQFPSYVISPGSATVTILDDDASPPPPPRCAVVQTGTNGVDTLVGGAGGDRLNGRGGADSLVGGLGDDCLFGGSGNDHLSGGAGADRLRGGTGNDVVSAGDGNDSAAGEAGRDRVLGGNGNDRLGGGSGNDSLSGGAGNDRLTGGSGRNRLAGGRGNDTLQARNRRVETVNCGPGRDRAVVDRRDRTRGCERVSRARR
ncbi:MAG TPA: DUF4394 domain-containing protein [Thermoleophilaceae bacterium]|nr:DUF4394 domain-containing protein [Thermoleophilaceae bacterium]